MKHTFLFVAALFSFFITKAQVVDVDPVWSGTIYGNCITIGNTNTELKDFPDGEIPPRITEEEQLQGKKAAENEFGSLQHRTDSPDGYPEPFTNMSSAEFCIPAPEGCDTTEIEFAYLSWGGRSSNTASLNNVQICVGQGGLYLPNTYSTQTSTQTKHIPYINSTAAADYYSCHVDITSYFNTLIQNSNITLGNTYKFYVANIETEMDPFGEVNGLFSGWTLNIVYKKCLESKRSIMVYAPDAIGEENTGGAGTTGFFLNFNFDKAEPYSGNDTIVFGFTGFGGFVNVSESFASNAANKQTALSTTELAGNGITFLNNPDGMDNPFRSSVYYDYKTKQCGEISQNITYARGFDMHVARINPGIKHIQKNDAVFRTYITKTNENHFVTNAVIIIGAPDIPEVSLAVIPESETVPPGEEFKVNLFVAIGENKEGLKDIKLVIPISEYIEKVTAFSITSPITAISSRLNIRPKINSVQTTYSITNSNFEVDIIDKINTALELKAKDIEEAILDGKVFKNHEIIIELTGLTIPFEFPNPIPTQEQKNEAIKISLTLQTKPDGNMVYEKATYWGKSAVLVPQAGVSVTTEKSGSTSIFESGNEKDVKWGCYRCELVCKPTKPYDCDGGPGGGGPWGPWNPGDNAGCATLTDNSVSGNNGVYKKNNQELIAVEILAKADCIKNLPDTITIPFCDELTMSIADLDNLIKEKYEFDIDSLARKDSLLWKQMKRDSLLAFSKKYGVNLAMMERLLGITSGGEIEAFGKPGYERDTLKGFLNCQGVDFDVLANDIDKIINMEIKVSRLLVLFETPDTTEVFANDIGDFESMPRYSIKEAVEKGLVFNVKENKKGYIFFDCPWSLSNKENGNACDSVIVVDFVKKENIKLPSIQYDNGVSLEPEDTIYLCNGADLPLLEVLKSDPWYDVYAEIVESPDNLYDGNSAVIDKTLAETFMWDINDLNRIENDKPGVTKIAVTQRDIKDNCESDTFYFYISISTIQLDGKPTIDASNFFPYCQSLSPFDSITLRRVVPPMEDPDLNITWYSIGDDKISRSPIGNADTVNIAQDIAGNFGYAVTFEKDHCESDTSYIIVNINPKANTIPPVTIQICQGYELTKTDITSKVKAKSATDKIFWYKYRSNGDETNLADTLRYISESIKIKADSITTSELLTEINSVASECKNSYFVALPQTNLGCFGTGTVIKIERLCYINSAPKFNGDVDSVLYCVGDSPNNLDYFINKEENPAKYEWFWYENAGSVPMNNFNRTITVPEPIQLMADEADRNSYYVIRVDSNNCVSEPSEFKVIVDNSINTFPLIGDTINTSSDSTFLFCKGERPYLNNILPSKPSNENYVLEWYKKDGFDSNCDVEAGKPARLPERKIVIDFQYPDTSYYCVRQSTQLGCKGPWRNIQIVVNDSVRELPVISPIILCQGASPVNIETYVGNPNPADLFLEYYDQDKNPIFVVDANVATDVAGKFTTTDRNNLFYVALKNKKTGCVGDTIGIDITINKKPELPVVENTVLYFCENHDEISLTQTSKAKVNPADIDTKLVWEPTESLSTDREMNRLKYYVYQKDTITNCEGGKIEIEVSTEKTFDYTPVDTVALCSNSTLDLITKVEKSIKSTNSIIGESKIGYSIKKLNGVTAGATVTGDISVPDKYLNDTQRFLIEVKDTVSGCFVSDTATVIFKSLPVLTSIPDIVVCQFTDTVLPTPVNPDYAFEWHRADGSRIVYPDRFQLENSETIWLVAVTKDTLLCTDSISVAMDIKQNPLNAIVKNDTVCQFSGVKDLQYAVNPSAGNNAADLYIRWFDEAGDELVQNAVNTNIDFATPTLIQKYTARQENIVTGCYSDTTISIVINKAYTLNMPDISRVCQPETINFKEKVNSYLNQAGIQNVGIEYFRINEATPINAENIEYTAGKDSVQYAYTIEDSRKICRAADTVWVVINQKPSVPLIENGMDTIYFCQDNAPLSLSAKNTNVKPDDTKIVWRDLGEGVLIEIPNNIHQKTYTAISVNKETGCESDADSVVVVIADPVEVSTIGTNGVLEYCTNETIDLYEIAFNSFSVDLKRLSSLRLTATKDGYSITDFTAVNETVQDTAEYIFTLTDDLTGCSASNTAKVIFHTLPNLEIDGKTTICQTDVLELQAVGEPRPVNYFWRYELNGSNISTSGAYSQAGLMEDTTIILIGNLIDRDVCSDTVYQKITVNPQPESLKDTVFYFCQNELGTDEIISLVKTDAAYSLNWYSKEKVLLKENANEISVSIKNDTTLTFFVKQISAAKCESEFSEITVTVRPQVKLAIDEPEAICAPATFDLHTLVHNSISGGSGEFKIIEAEKDNQPLTDLDYLTRIDASGMYKITVSDKYECTAAETVKITVHDQPKLPIVENEVLYFCESPDEISLTEATKAKINPLNINTKLVWEPTESFSTDREMNRLKYYVYQKDTITGCEGEKIEIEVSTEKTFEYTPVDTIALCSNETFDLIAKVENSFRSTNVIIGESRTGYSIRKLNGVTAGETVTGDISARLGNYNNDTQRFYIEVKDTISGCFVSDTATIIFRSLPALAPIPDITVCQFTDTVLPTPVNPEYTFEWHRAGGSRIFNPGKFQLESSETIYLIAVTSDALQCVDSIPVIMDIRQNPLNAIVESDTVCRFSGEKELLSALNPSGGNSASNLRVRWFDESGEELLTNIVSTDIDFTTATLTQRYTARQENTITGCYSDTTISIVINQTFTLNMPDIPRICQPGTVNLKEKVNSYLNSHSSTTGIQGVVNIEYFKIINNVATQIDGEKIEYTSERDSVQYMYAVEDSRKICRVADTVWAVINQKPSLPLIENGMDTIYFCQDNAPLFLSAKNTNVKPDDTKILWKDLGEGDRVEIPNNIRQKTYTAISVNKETGCESDADSIVVVIADPVEVSIIGTNGVLEYCTNETVDLYEIAFNSFSVDANLKHLSSLRLTATKDGYSIIDFTAVNETVQDTAEYIFTLTDDLTGCSASNTAKIIFHTLPNLEIDGKTTICQTDILELQAVGEPRPVNYFWRYELNGSNISTSNAYSQTGLMEDTTIILIGNLIDRDVCSDTVYRKITVNPQPESLKDTVFYFCQNELAANAETVSLERTSADYFIQWYDSEREPLEDVNISVSIKEAKTFTFFVKQINKTTLCESEFSKVTVTVQPQIQIALETPDAICAPATFDLENLARNSATVAGNHTLNAYKFTRIESNGSESEVADATRIDRSGQYRVYYEYISNIRCEASGTVSVTINEQPAKPALDERFHIFCQTGNDEKITPNPIAGDFSLVWRQEGSPDTVEGESYIADTHVANATPVSLIVYRKNNATGCPSDTTMLKYQVMDSIRHKAIDDIEICTYQSVDLNPVAENTFKSGNTLTFSFFKSDAAGSQNALLANVSAIQDAGYYLIHAIDSYSGCEARETVRVITNTPPQISIDGKTELCDGEDLKLTASATATGKPLYTWYNSAKEQLGENELFQYHINLRDSEKAQTDTFYLKAVDVKGCETEQMIKVTTHPNPEKLEDASYIFCQNTGMQSIQIEYNAQYRLLIDGIQQTAISVPTDEAGSPSFIIRQQDGLTGCQSELAVIQATVAPALQLNIPEQEPVCTPATVDLASVVLGNSITGGSGAFEIKQAEKDAGLLADLDYLTRIDASGIYKITVVDKFGCTTSGSVRITVNEQPAKPAPDNRFFIFCQMGIDTTIALKQISGNFTFLWQQEGSAEIFEGGEYPVVTDKPSGTPVNLIIRRKNSDTGCLSDTAMLKYQVLDSIRHNAIPDIEICTYQSVDLNPVAENTFKSDNSLTFSFFNQNVLITNVNAIQNAGNYLIRATDSYSGCIAQETVRVITNTPPQISIDGKTELCDGEDLKLTASATTAGKPLYTWYNNLKVQLGENELFQYHIDLKESEKAQTDTFYLKAVDLKGCETEQMIKVTTHPNPHKLQDTSYVFCQNTGTMTVPVEYDLNCRLLIFDRNGAPLDRIEIPTDEAGSLSFIIRQENSLTGCQNDPAVVQVTVVPALQLEIPAQTPVCAPAVLDMKTLALNSITGGSGGFEIKEAEKDATVLADLNSLTQINSSGMYKITVSDKFSCTASGMVNVTIYEQPQPPAVPDGKLDFCQNTGSQLLKALPAGENTKLQWLDETGIFSDSVFVQTGNVITGKTYNVRQIHTLSNCASETATVKITVHPEIRPALADTVLCYGASLNLVEMAKAGVNGGTSPQPYSFASLTPALFDAENIVKNGTFIATYTDATGVCSANDTLNVTFDREIDLSVSGSDVICAGDTIRLKADGTDFYAWQFNGVNISNESGIEIPTSLLSDNPDGLQDTKTITLSASRIIDHARNLVCENSRDISVTVKKVPGLISGKADTSYCQNTDTQPLALNPTHADAKVEWLDADNFNTIIYGNGTLRPVALQAGEFTYKFRQSLNGCYTAWQDYTVLIQEEIKAVATLRDTAYCQDQPAAPLIAASAPEGYTVKWYHENGTEIENLPFTPSTQTIGTQHFYARLSKGVCVGEPVRVSIGTQNRYPNAPQVEPLVIFCQNTGEQILTAKPDFNAGLNWYETAIGNERLEKITIPTGNTTQVDKSYFVSQSILKGCESERARIDVRVVNTPEPRTIRVDTCANTHFTVAHIAQRENITETIDTLWHGKEKEMRISLQNSIGNHGTYRFSVFDENNCRATHTVETYTHRVENLSLAKSAEKYCPGDSVRFEASADNGKEYVWIEEATGNTVYGNVYREPIPGTSNFLLIASENVLECKDTLYFTAATYPQPTIRIDGETSLCAGESTTLTVNAPLTGIAWTMPDLTVRTGNEITFAPEETGRITVSGRDVNNCPATATILVNTATVPAPQIGITKLIASSAYHINRDTAGVIFRETALPEYGESPYTYVWEFGDGNTTTGNYNDLISHEYEDRLVRFTKGFDVRLTVTHEYGCEGAATARIAVDPDFRVPNTYAYGDGLFMEKYELQIFDRIGNLIYEGEGWDGTYKGQPAFADTYFYALTYYVEGEKNIKTGYVTLVR